MNFFKIVLFVVILVLPAWTRASLNLDVTVDRSAVVVGGSTVIRWAYSGISAESCSLDWKTGDYPLNSEITYSPGSVGTKTLTVKCGISSTSIKVTGVAVDGTAPKLFVTATPSIISPGQSAEISWTAAPANQLSSLGCRPEWISSAPAYGAKSETPLVVTPNITTQYKIRCIFNGAIITESAAVTVVPTTNSLEFTATPKELILGESTKLRWKDSRPNVECIPSWNLDEVYGATINELKYAPDTVGTQIIRLTCQRKSGVQSPVTVLVSIVVKPKPVSTTVKQEDTVIAASTAPENEGENLNSIVSGSINFSTIPEADDGVLVVSAGTEVLFSWSDKRDGATCRSSWDKTAKYKFGVMLEVGHKPRGSGIYSVTCTAGGVSKTSSVRIIVVPVPAGTVSIKGLPAENINNSSATLKADILAGQNSGVYTGSLYLDYATSVQDFSTSLNTRLLVKTVTGLPDSASVDINGLSSATEYFTRFCLRSISSVSELCSSVVSFKTFKYDVNATDEIIPAESVALSLSPDEGVVSTGDIVTLLWGASPVENTKCTMSSIGSVRPTGFMKVVATIEKTYTITCSFAGVSGSKSASKTITIVDAESEAVMNTESAPQNSSTISNTDDQFSFTGQYTRILSGSSAEFGVALVGPTNMVTLPGALYFDYVPLGSTFDSSDSTRVTTVGQKSGVALNEVYTQLVTGLDAGKSYNARFCLDSNSSVDLCGPIMVFIAQPLQGSEGNSSDNSVGSPVVYTTDTIPTLDPAQQSNAGITTSVDTVKYSIVHGGSSNQVVYSYLPRIINKSSARMEVVVVSPECPATVTLYTKKSTGGGVKKKIKKLRLAPATRYSTIIKPLLRNTKYKMWAKVVNCNGTSIGYPVYIKTKSK